MAEEPSVTLPEAAPPPGAPSRLMRGRPARPLRRARSIGLRYMRAAVAAAAVSNPEPTEPRPRTRGECIGGARPCPWVGCRHHLYLDLNPETGSIKLNYPEDQPWELEESCSLDVAERGEHNLEDIGARMNLTRERIRQIEIRALTELRIVAPE